MKVISDPKVSLNSAIDALGGRPRDGRMTESDANTNVQIRGLRSADAAAAADLIRAAFAAQSGATDPPSGALGETTASVSAKLAEGGGAGAEANGVLVGVVLWAEKDGALAIGRVSVTPAWRGRGIARALLAAGEAEARRRGLKRMTLRVRLALGENQRLFAGFGFAAIGQGAHPGHREPTFLVMEKRLD
jgi:predicted N-acetyltransferase YhbS